jgi:hypothetical protein
MGPGNSVLLKSRAKQAARERSAMRNPALRPLKSTRRAKHAVQARDKNLDAPAGPPAESLFPHQEQPQCVCFSG